MRWARVAQVSSVFLLLLVSDLFLVFVHASISTMVLSSSVKEGNESEVVRENKLKTKINETNSTNFANVLWQLSKKASSFLLPHVQLSSQNTATLSNRRKRNSDPARDKKIMPTDSTTRYVRLVDSSDLTEKRYSHDSLSETSNSPLNYATDGFSTSSTQLKHTAAVDSNTSRGVSLRTTRATTTNYTNTASFTTKSTVHNKQYTKAEKENQTTQPINELTTLSTIAASEKSNEDSVMNDDGSATYSNSTTSLNADERYGNFTQHNQRSNSTVLDSNSVNDSNNNALTSTMNLIPEIWESTSTLGPENYIPWTSTDDDKVDSVSPPLLSSNSANSIASDPTMESIDGHRQAFDVGAIIGIALGAVILVILIAGICGILIYNRRLRPLSEVKYPTDNCGYVDDSLRVSYMNNHIELPKDSSEEMFSLDNDSFLNSLEAMTLQNYWAEDAKNTKV